MKEAIEKINNKGKACVTVQGKRIKIVDLLAGRKWRGP